MILEMGIENWFQLINDNKLEAKSVSNALSLSVPLINAQACDAKRKKEELDWVVQPADCLQQAH